jgi:pyridoxamine 5'-phosphate oxidase
VIAKIIAEIPLNPHIMHQDASISSIRREYMRESLSESDVHSDPFRQFDRWWAEALKADIDEVNAMTLSTLSTSGFPGSRIVLLKGYDDHGFVWYTNYESRKGRELTEHPKASLLFFWKELERQIRIEGVCERVSSEESDTYFNARPEGSRIGAWASPQSKTIESREILDRNIAEISERFSDTPIYRPPHWGGYRLKPVMLEFWQGRPSRLHDRIRYDLQDGEGWKLTRLAP